MFHDNKRHKCSQTQRSDVKQVHLSNDLLVEKPYWYKLLINKSFTNNHSSSRDLMCDFAKLTII